MNYIVSSCLQNQGLEMQLSGRTLAQHMEDPGFDPRTEKKKKVMQCKQWSLGPKKASRCLEFSDSLRPPCEMPHFLEPTMLDKTYGDVLVHRPRWVQLSKIPCRSTRHMNEAILEPPDKVHCQLIYCSRFFLSMFVRNIIL
jgi:hypothetical protein